LRTLLCLFSAAAVFTTGCGRQVSIENSYSVYSSKLNTYDAKALESSFFASDLCVTDGTDIGTGETDSQVAEAAGLFNLTTEEITYSQNIFGKMYPASTTKILTAYIIIRDCNLSDMVTVSENAVDQPEDSSVCNLKAGDVISVKNLLYGLLLVSGNDAAIALAEFHSGSVDAFTEEMNQTAKELGATGSSFMNPNGLPDENHYTTVYDMYLIFKEAVQQSDFLSIIGTEEVTVNYLNKDGDAVEKTWTNTNRYISGKVDAPEGFTVLGGKTGTTNAAGYCLVLYSTNSNGDKIISIVFKADGRSNLYMLMNEILKGFAK
jgi:D-alanyl-D-alanine carboxypeptidase (penicillin-binding protein 5/6)